MSWTINDAFVQAYNGTVRFLAQQMNSRLRPCVVEDMIIGEAGFMEQLAPTFARKVQSRHGDTPLMHTQSLRRRITPFGYEWGDLIDQLDNVKLLIDPTSAYTKAAGFAMARAYDDEIMAACWGTAYTGHTGSTALTWPNGNNESTPTAPAGTQVAVNSWTYGTGSGNAGLTISKLIEAKVALDAAEGDDMEEERFLVLSGRARGQLLATTEATSADYNTVKALASGQIDTFLGFKIIHSERILQNGSSQYRYPAFRRSALGLGINKDIDGNIAQRPDKRFAWQVYSFMSIGASRLEESKLVEIICT